MFKKTVFVFGGSWKSKKFIDFLKPDNFFLIDDVKTKSEYIDVLSSINSPDVDVFCVNWPFITPDEHLKFNNIYTIHESLLPSYSGCAPVNWSIIEGSKIFGLTLFRQSPIIDGGAILFADGFYCGSPNALNVFSRLESTYQNCAKFIRSSSDLTDLPLGGFGNRRYYAKRGPTDSVIKDGFDPEKVINLFLSTTADYPLIYESIHHRFKVYAIKVFDEIIDYYPLGSNLAVSDELRFYDDNFILIGEYEND